jgi:hypothetical protein
MKYIIRLLITGVTAGLLSCESLVTTIPESKLPKGTEKVVLHAYISPQDTLILVKLTLSSPLLGVYRNNGFGYTVVGNDTIYYTGGVVENASVILSDSKKQSVSIPYIKSEGAYLLDARKFPIVAGETYTITAETHKGNVEATCTVPKENVIITDYKIDTTTNNNFNTRAKTFRINFDWKDIPDQTNFYTVKASIVANMLLQSATANYDPEKIEKKIIYSAYWDEENRQLQYQSDISRNGAVFSTPNGYIPIGSEVVYGNGKAYWATFAGEKSTITLEVLNTEKNYYDYHRAVRINNRQDGNPFVEPVPIPTNVKNGLGCFAASNKSILTVVY